MIRPVATLDDQVRAFEVLSGRATRWPVVVTESLLRKTHPPTGLGAVSQTVTITDDDDSLVRALSQGFQGPIIVSAAPSQWRAVAGRKDVPVPTTVGAPYSSVASTLEALGPRWWSRLVLAMPGGLPTSEDLKLLQTRLGEPPRAPGLQWMAMEAVDEMVRGLTRLGAGLSRERLIETMNSPGDRVSAGRRGGDDVTLVRIAADGRLQPLAPDEVSRIFLEQQQ